MQIQKYFWLIVAYDVRKGEMAKDWYTLVGPHTNPASNLPIQLGIQLILRLSRLWLQQSNFRIPSLVIKQTIDT